MQSLPHHYRVGATAEAEGEVTLSAEGLESLPSAPPAEFGGPGDRWSPESLLVASVADCFVLSFRAIARASRLDWTALSCDVVGTLERKDGLTQFTRFETHARLRVPGGTDAERARKILDKAEQACLITNSLKGECHLEAEVVVQ
ncbi:MAG TPA: OsmC family protein [Steroidobacteraceae bacterium]|nr:OsmC family protein [Steroidobacteraceae bacterium]